MTKTIAMIPARMGSQRLKKKNLRELGGLPLIVRAIRKCKQAECFDEIWVNSEDSAFELYTEQEGVNFYKRPKELGNDQATSEQFVADFLGVISCDYVVQVHSIAPLLMSDDVRKFTHYFTNSRYDVLLSCIEDQIEVAYKNQPVNFSFAEKTNSQDLMPTQRITWSITGWKSKSFIGAFNKGKCATYSGQVGFFPVNPISGHVIKTQQDLDIAEALLGVVE